MGKVGPNRKAPGFAPGGKKTPPRVGLDRLALLTGAAALACVVVTGSGCRDRYAGGELAVRHAVLRREVEGLRPVVARLERQEPMMPPGDASIAVRDSLVRDIIASQLPLEADLDRFHIRLEEAQVVFRGNAIVRLLGTLHLRRLPSVKAQVDVIGALEGLTVDPSSSILSARLAIDHFGIEKGAGLLSSLSGSTRSELGRLIRLKVKDHLPEVQIPLLVQQTIDLPTVTGGSVGIGGASLPLKVTVSQVTALRGRLWVALHIEAGEMTKITEAPAASAAGQALTKPPGKGN